MSKLTAEDIKSGRYISWDQLIDHGDNPAPSSVMISIDNIDALNVVDELLFAHKITVYDKNMDSECEMSGQIKTIISTAMLQDPTLSREDIALTIESILGPEEFKVTAVPLVPITTIKNRSGKKAYLAQW